MKNLIRKSIGISVFSLILVLFFAGAEVSAQNISCLNLIRTLRDGGTQTRIETMKLQDFLYRKSYLEIAPTGYFGPLTVRALKKFQQDYGIDMTGIAGPITRAKISSLTCQDVSSDSSANVNPISNPIPTQPIPVSIPPASQSPKNIILPFTTTSFSDWLARWGEISTTTDTMHVDAVKDTYGAQIIFPKSMNLTDYKYSANIFVKRGSFVLIARYVDDNNFIGCSFGGKTVEIIQRLNGKSETMAGAYVPEIPYANYFFSDINVSMNVKGNKVGCTLLGKEENVSYSNVHSSLLKGGVGVQNWYSTVGIASLEVRSISLQDN